MSDITEETQPLNLHSSKRVNFFRKYVSYVLIGLLIGAMLFMVQVVAWAAESSKPLEVKNSPTPVRTIREHPQANGVVILDIDYCKNTKKSGHVRTSWVSEGREIFSPIVEENFQQQCTRREFPVLVPRDLPEGNYYIKFRVTYNLNPLNSSVVSEFYSDKFVIDPSGNVENKPLQD